MKYRVLVTKTLDVPKNLFHAMCDTEEEAKKLAQEKLIALDGDVAVVSVVTKEFTKVLLTFEQARKAV